MGSGVGLGSESEKYGSLPKSPGFNLVGGFWGVREGSGKGDVKQLNWAVVTWDWVDALETVNKTHESERGQRQTKEEKTTIVFARKVIQTSSQKSAACVLHSDH